MGMRCWILQGTAELDSQHRPAKVWCKCSHIKRSVKPVLYLFCTTKAVQKDVHACKKQEKSLCNTLEGNIICIISAKGHFPKLCRLAFVPEIYAAVLRTIGWCECERPWVRSLVQAPAQNRASSGIRQGCSGLSPGRSWKPPRTEAGCHFHRYTVLAHRQVW